MKQYLVKQDAYYLKPRLIAYCFLILLFSATKAKTQNLNSPYHDVIENIIEEIAASSDEELDYSSLFDDLHFYHDNPININNTNLGELEKLQFLNEFQIKSILNYIEENGEFLSIYELQLLYGFNQEILNYLLPFIKVGPFVEVEPFPLKNALKYGNNELFLRYQQILENQKGYSDISDSLYEVNPNSRYLGGQAKLYAKYKYSYSDKLMWGFTMEKDPGEEFFTGTQKNGFDYYSAYVQVQKIGKIKTLVLGDYKMKSGQGLNIWSGFAGGKSSYVLNTKKKGNGLSKYSSTDENKFFRGIANTIDLGDFELTTFFSYKPVDANIDSLFQNQEVYSFTSLQNSGYHSTPNEIFDKDAVQERVFGTDLNYTKNKLKIGFNYINYSIDASSSKTIGAENLADKYISNYSNFGVNYQYYFKNISLFGEISGNKDFNFATVNGMSINLTNQVYLNAVYRFFDKEFYSYYGNAFSENSKIVNEKGLYYGLEIYPYRNWKISVYFDSYEFPYLKSTVNAPTTGTDLFLQADYSPKRNVSMYIRYKNEVKQINGNDDSTLISVLNSKKSQKLRYHINYKVSENLQLKNRIEFAFISCENTKTETGYIIYQDINYSFIKTPLNISFRYAVFDTESYNSRIYAYENDILYAFSIPAYYYKGTRSYLTMRYNIANGLDIWLRLAQTYYSNKDNIGSGLAEIDGRTKTDVKVQIRYKF